MSPFFCVELVFVISSLYDGSLLNKKLKAAVALTPFKPGELIVCVVVLISNPTGSPTLSQNRRVNTTLVFTSGQNSLIIPLLAVSKKDPVVPTIGGVVVINTFFAPLS